MTSNLDRYAYQEVDHLREIPLQKVDERHAQRIYVDEYGVRRFGENKER